jgi:uncharacterized protein involved in outer membrane biogenesis
VTADVSAVDLMAGKNPSEITLTGASIALRFDENGKLITRLPAPKPGDGGSLPRLHIANGKLTLNQERRPPMLIQGIQADFGPSGTDLRADGSIADPFWGDWSLNGVMAKDGGVDLTLSTKGVQVTKARLTGLPFVAPAVWREVMVEGQTPCDFNLRFTMAERPEIHYRVALAPQDAKVHIESIQMDADRASGAVVVDDNLVTLRGVQGRFAGGELRTDADLDFRQEAWKLKFPMIEVDKVAVHDMPQRWTEALKLRGAGIDGQLTGKANIEVNLVNGRVEVSGSGKGQVDHATVAGFPTSEPIQLTLVTENGSLVGKPMAMSKSDAAAVVATALIADSPPAFPHSPSPPPGYPTPTPAGLARWMPDATTWAVGRAAGALTSGLSTVGQALNQKKTPEEPTSYLTAKLSLQDVDLGELLRRLDVKLPFPVEGKLSVTVNAGIPINDAQNAKAYRLDGTANLPTVTVAGVEMADVHARVHYDQGFLDLQELKGKALPPTGDKSPPGTFQGTARVEVSPIGDLSGDARVDHFPLGVVLGRLPGAAGTAEGAFSGHVTARAPVTTLTDPTTWHATGSLSSDRIGVYGLALTGAAADVSVDGGTAKATNLKATLEKATVTGEAHLKLSAPWAYGGTLTAKGTDLAQLKQLAPDFRPPFPVAGRADLTADLSGALDPASVKASGTADGSDLVLDQLKVDSLSFKWDMDGDRIKLTDARAKLYQGAASGTAAVPVRPAAAGGVDLRLDDVDVKALAASIPSLPLRLQGQASGTIQATIPPAGPDGERPATGKIDLSAKSLRVQNIPTDNLHADVEYKAGVAEYHLKGDSLGGHFTLDGKVPFTEEKKPAPPGGGAPPDQSQPEASGRFRFTGIRLTRLWEALGLGETLGQIRGRLDIDLPFRFVGPDNTPVGNGTASVRNLRIGDTLLTDSLNANLVLRDQTVQVRNLNATVGQGQFHGVVSYNYHDPNRSFFRLRLEQVDAAALLAAYPDLADAVSGPVDLRLRGNLGRAWRGNGEADLARGRVYGAAVNELRLPFSFEFHPRRGSGQVRVADANAQLAGGRATAQAELHWTDGEAPRLEGYARFNNAEVRGLQRPGGQLGDYLVGKVTGRVDFGADSLRSADDLTATLAATLHDSQALEIPVLNALVPFVAPGQSATTFQNGEVRGRLARGVFRIQRLTLSSRVIQMAVVGNITTQGRIDLDVTAHTGTFGVNPAFLRLAGLPIPAAGPIPLSVLLEASALLSNRVVHARVTGTTRNPNVQLEPVQILAEEAVRFFVLESGVPVP